MILVFSITLIHVDRDKQETVQQMGGQTGSKLKKKRNKKYKILISNNKQKIKKGTKNKRGIHILIVFT